MAEGTRSHTIPLNLPRFDGADPIGWISKASWFFDFHSAADDQRLQISSFYMDGAALRWFQGIHRTTPFSTWTAFTRSLEVRFASSDFDSASQSPLVSNTDLGVVQSLVSIETLRDSVEMKEESKVRSDYLFLDSVKRCAKIISECDLCEGGFVDSDVSSWIDLGSEPRNGDDARGEVKSAADEIADLVTKLKQALQQGDNPTTAQGIEEKPQQKETLQQESLVNPAPTNSANSEVEFETDEEESSDDSETQTPTKIQSRRDSSLCYNCIEELAPRSHCKSQQLFLLMYDELLGLFNWSDHFLELSKFWIPKDFLKFALLHNNTSLDLSRSTMWLKFCLAVLILSNIAVSLESAVSSIDLDSKWMKAAVVNVKPGQSLISVPINEMSKKKSRVLVAFQGGNRLLGEEAARIIARYPDKVFFQVRDMIRKPLKYVKGIIDFHCLPFNLVEDSRGAAAIRIDDGYSAEELVAMFISYGNNLADFHSTLPIKDAVITVPLCLGQAERKGLLQAAKLAVIEVLLLINEHSGIALQYGIDKNFANESKHVIFYDMGSSGTYAALVHFFAYSAKEYGKTDVVNQFQVKDVRWNTTFGGQRMELRLVEDFVDDFSYQVGNGVDVRKFPKATVKLKKQVKRTKEFECEGERLSFIYVQEGSLLLFVAIHLLHLQTLAFLYVGQGLSSRASSGPWKKHVVEQSNQGTGTNVISGKETDRIEASKFLEELFDQDTVLQHLGWIVDIDHQAYCIVNFVISFSFGIGSIPWVLMLVSIKGLAGSVSTLCNWVITMVHLPLNWSRGGTFTLYTAVNVFSLAFVTPWVPTTKEKTFKEAQWPNFSSDDTLIMNARFLFDQMHE
ncbi:hypothetical protein NE237_005536 [Protea cynaroides]|uniref:Uncharacterized protein n=1 Tax=Protea cynaroides TaxID=273540 RepID=A0A9Q0GP76_9MAGN|nr:hypothetical protein NE237_005536 [Protea cynaroides]